MESLDEYFMHIDENGWCSGVMHYPSPNFNARPSGLLPYLLVIHNISLPPNHFGNGFITDLFTNKLDWAKDPFFETIKGLEVSSHFLIQRDGQIVQYVSTNDRAWHAGKSSFNGIENCNDFSVGIELEGTDFKPFENIQYRRLRTLTLALEKRYTIKNVTGHEHIAPGRKTDPGPFFDWLRYHKDLRIAGSNISVNTNNNTC